MDYGLRQLAKVLSVALVVGALAIAPAAYAQSGPAETTYGGEGVPTAQVERGEEAVAEPGALPFSGLDLALLALGAVVLAGTGAGLARVAARSQQG